MTIPAIIHLAGEDAIFGELDEVPNPTHNFVFLRKIRQKNGKELAYVADGAEVFLFAWHKITFIEIMADVALPTTTPTKDSGLIGVTAGLKPAGTTVLSFFRDDET